MSVARHDAAYVTDPAAAEALRDAVREKYAAVAETPEGKFPYPVGRAGAERLGYAAAWLDAVPADVVARFVGVGDPLAVRRPAPGEHVLALGCGAGVDTLVAATLVGADGRAVGIDLVPEMLALGRAARAAGGFPAAEFREGSIEALPLPDASVDLAISNGVLNLVPDKLRAFREIARVLRPGGILAAADLVVIDTIPADVLARADAWST